MRKKIKIIDILCYISVGEYDKLPERIKDKWHTYTKIERKQELEGSKLVIEINYQDELGSYLFGDAYVLSDILNDEMEILDEEDEFEDIEVITENIFFDMVEKNDDGSVTVPYLTRIETMIVDKINDLIKNQKKIIERLNNGMDN